ncbi:MAG: aspartate aminotransferase family protein [Actinobacteria bacterium]|nr:aspartate aminotransferase family protein [Actinomycetota bacterium]
MDERLDLIEKKDKQYVMNTYKRLPVAFVRGEGVRLQDSAGREYLDLVSGLGVAVLGHCHPRVTSAINRQAGELLHTTNLYYIEPQVELAELLVENSFEGKCFFANSGAEANEGAIKLARKHHHMLGNLRTKVVCVEGSFHGRTLAAMSATGQPSRWGPFEPVVPGFVHVPLNDIGALGKEIDENTAAVMLEPIQGESGIRPASDDFMMAARSSCDATGALLIVDEVQSGLGRTGDLFAYEHSGVRPDIMTLAKGIANGIPAACFVAAGALGDVFTPGDHGSTFGGGFLACSAALETLKVILEEDLKANAERIGRVLFERLEAMVDRIPAVTEVRGRGLMLAIQLDGEKASEAVLGCLERGVLTNDVTPSAVRILPPLIINEEEALEGLRVLEGVLSGL